MAVNRGKPSSSHVGRGKGLNVNNSALILQFMTWDLKAVSNVPTYLANAALETYFGSLHSSC